MAGGHVLNRAAIDVDQPFDERRIAMVRFAIDGTATDTLFAPDYPYESPTLRAESVVGDGRCLGQVRAPEGFSQRPASVFRGDSVRAVVRDEFDVEYLVRFRIERMRDRV